MFCIWSTEHDDPSAGVIPGKVKHQLKGLLLVWKRGFMIWACQWVQVSIARPTSNDSKIPAKGSPHSILNCWMTVSCLTRNGWMVQIQALLEISKIFEGLNTLHGSLDTGQSILWQLDLLQVIGMRRKKRGDRLEQQVSFQQIPSANALSYRAVSISNSVQHPLWTIDAIRACSKANRRKFRSQTSDNMERWKSRGGMSQRREEQKRDDQRREKIRRKKMQMREKVGKSRNTVFFQWFGVSEGRKVGSLKRRVRSQLARWEMNSCTPLWREAHLEVKMYKAHHGSWHVEKVHAVVARSTFPGQKSKKWQFRSTFGRSDFVSHGRRRGLCTWSKVRKTWGFCGSFKNDGKRGEFAVSRGTRSTRDIGGQGADFLRGVAFWSIRSSSLPRWFCVAGAALRMTWHHLFVPGAVL